MSQAPFLIEYVLYPAALACPGCRGMINHTYLLHPPYQVKYESLPKVQRNSLHKTIDVWLAKKTSRLHCVLHAFVSRHICLFIVLLQRELFYKNISSNK